MLVHLVILFGDSNEVWIISVWFGVFFDDDNDDFFAYTLKW